jgi:NADPH-dependent 2,4-dienoyl-CoA reductase/sulfur reductase-like enzyme
MPYNLAAPERDIEELVVRRAEVFREKQGINLLTGHCAHTIDSGNRIVSGSTLEDKKFELSYDRLLIATGGNPIVPELPGFDLPGIITLKTLGDGRYLKTILKTAAVTKAVLVGMGYINLEMCEALVSLGIDVDMVKPGPVFLPWLEPSMAQSIKEEIESRQVGIHAGHAVERIEKTADGLQVICPDLKLTGDLVIVGIGIRPNSTMAADAGLELSVGQSIATDRRACTSDGNIYAAGDCADAYHVVSGQKTWIPLALRANRAGWAVADNVCGKNAELEGVAGTAVFKVFDFEVARTGLTAAEAAGAGFEPVENMIKARSKAHGHPGSSPIQVNLVGDKKTGRLLGAQMTGKDGVAHRINGPAVALQCGMTVKQYSQTDLAYAPPIGPTWDPTLTAANQLLKKL